MKQEKASAGAPVINPCEHMQEKVSTLADGSLTGAASWYTRWHVLHCSRCGAALREMRALLAKVRPLRDTPPAAQPSTLTDERRAQMLAAIDRADSPPNERR